MGQEAERRQDRRMPSFFINWRSAWGESARSWTPLDYLNQADALPTVIAAGWLFNPPTVVYRGSVFLADRFDAAVVDEWFGKYPDEPGRIETVVNQTALYDLFLNCDLSPYEDALPSLATDIAACWAGVLTLRYPERRIQVQVDDGARPDSYGPAVTFWTTLSDVS